MKEYIIEKIRIGRTISDIAEEIGVNRRTIHIWFKKWNVDHQRLKFNHDFFEQIDSEEKAYWLGFIMADGHLCLTQSPRVVIHLAAKDESHLWKWHQSIESTKKLSRCCDETITSTHNSKKMCDDLVRLGCMANKSLKLEFPLLPKLLIRHFVRGYFDGDGCIEWRTHQKTAQLRVSFVGTRMFLTKLQEILGTDNKLQPTGKNKIARQLQVCGNIKAVRIADWMYKDSTVFLRRKKELYFANPRV